MCIILCYNIIKSAIVLAVEKSTPQAVCQLFFQFEISVIFSKRECSQKTVFENLRMTRIIPGRRDELCREHAFHSDTTGVNLQVSVKP